MSNTKIQKYKKRIEMKSLLNIQIEMNTLGKNEPVILAKAFYQWSSCTLTAFQLVKKIVDSEIYSTDISDPVEKAIRLLESTGAGLASTEFSEKYDEQNYNPSTSENAGVIIISEKGLQVEQDWEELIVSINISTGVIDMGGVFYVEEDLYELDPEEEIQNLTYSTYSHFNDFQKLYAEIQENKNIRLFRDIMGNEILSVVE